jgi:hypothetical protein
MPRTNRPRRRGASRDEDVDDLARLRLGWRRTEMRRGREWNVQPVSAASAVKAYMCPGCGRAVQPGIAHTVVWRADGVLGDAADLEARRHWHTACWQAF